MKISVVIPVFKVEDYIERCVLSVINQSYTNIEIIIIDDCSPDKSMSLAKQIIEHSSFTGEAKYIVHETNRGLSAARNTGITHSTGDYIYFLDSDDELPLDAIELLANQALQYQVDIVIGDYKMTGEKGSRSHLGISLPFFSKITKTDILKTFVNKQWPVIACNKLVRKELFCTYDLSFKEGIIHEDELWAFKLAYYAKSLIAIPNITYLYLIRSGSIMTTPSENSFSSKIVVVKELRHFIETHLVSSPPAVNYLYKFSFLAHLTNQQSTFSKEKKMYYYKEYVHALSSCSVKCSLSIKVIVRDMYRLMPSSLGYGYIKMIRSLLLPCLQQSNKKE